MSLKPGDTLGPYRILDLIGEGDRADIMPDGRFVGLLPHATVESGPAAPPQIQVVLNGFEELKPRVPR